jgi:hypothetical protein
MNSNHANQRSVSAKMVAALTGCTAIAVALSVTAPPRPTTARPR